MNYKLLDLRVFGDERGKLISLEGAQGAGAFGDGANASTNGGKSGGASNTNSILRGVPFEIKRVYWIFDTLPDFDRGLHAHRELEQVIVAMDGACQFVLDDGRTREKVWLNRPDRALYIGKNMWREMRHFSYGCKLMVLASEHYDEREYIRDYGEFLRGVKGGGAQ